MNDTLERELITKHSLIFDSRGGNPRAEVWGIECEDGWGAILDALCSEIQSYIGEKDLPQVRFHYVKEKFGELRISCIHADEYVSELVQRALLESLNTCERCGQAGSRKRLNSDWVKTLCEACASRQNSRT